MRLQLQERVNELQEVRAARLPSPPSLARCSLPACRSPWLVSPDCRKPRRLTPARRSWP